MSHLPTLWAITENRTDSIARMAPKVIILGDREAVAERMGVFQQRYQVYVESAGLAGLQQNAQKVHLSDGAYMHIISNGMQDTVYLYAERKGGGGSVPEGFLVTYTDGSQELYFFDMDPHELEDGAMSEPFPFVEVSDMLAGTHRKNAIGQLWVSWDGTGGGDIALESKEPEEGDYKTPVDDANPYGAYSRYVYCQGKRFPFLPGEDAKIVGMGVAGSTVMVATLASETITVHYGAIVSDAQSHVVEGIEYVGVVGSISGVDSTCKMVNFNADLTSCVVGEYILKLPEPKFWGQEQLQLSKYQPTMGSVETSILEKIRCLSSAYSLAEDGSEVLRFVYKRTLLTRAIGVYAPTNTYEFGPGWTVSMEKVTSGGVTYRYGYFWAAHAQAEVGAPSISGSYVENQLATVLVKPIIIFQGIYPTQIHTWMRTVLQVDATAENTYYWYRDYENDEYVRCNWSRGYVGYSSWDEYGAAEPTETDVQHSTAVNFNGQKIITKFGMSNWIYIVGCGKQSFIARKVINGTTGDAFLVSKLGATKTLTGVKHVGII